MIKIIYNESSSNIETEQRDLIVKKELRTWGVYSFFSCWVGMNVCIPAYQIASSAIAVGINWLLILALVFVGNTIILLPIILNAKPGVIYGISFPTLSMSVFGYKGSVLPGLIRALIGTVWTGVLSWIGAESISVFLSLCFEPWKFFKYGQLFCFVVFSLINCLVALKGSNTIKRLEGLSFPLFLVFCAFLLAWSIHKTSHLGYTFFDVINNTSQISFKNNTNDILLFLVANISFYSTWAINSSDISRYSKGVKEHNLGVALGLPLSMVFVAFLGIYITGVSKIAFGSAIWNPNELILLIGNKWISLLSAVIICLEMLNTNIVTNILPPTNVLISFIPKKIDYSKGVIITILLSIIVRPWRIIEDPSGYIYEWLNFYGVLTGPLASILIVDYYIVKKQIIELSDYEIHTRTKYWYSNGYNLKAIIAWCVSVIPSILGSAIRSIYFLRVYGWIISFFLGFTIYLFMHVIKTKKHFL